MAQDALFVEARVGQGDLVEVSRVGRVEDGVWFVRREKPVDVLLGGNLDRHDGVGQDVAVVTDHDRGVEGLGDLVGLNDGIDDLLVVAAVDLNPARVALGHRVLLVVEHVPRGGHGAIDAAHDQRQPPAGGPMDQLAHVGQAVGAGRGERARAHGRRADAHGQRAVLALDGDVLRLQLPPLDKLRQVLRHLGLGRDGIGGDDLDAAQLRAQGHGFVAGNDGGLGLRYYGQCTLLQDSPSSCASASAVASATMVMASVGHSSAQIPHPLQ